MDMKRRFFLVVILSLVLSTGFYGNSRNLIAQNYYEYWQKVFEAFIVGRLNLSQQEGLLSAGGLLVLGNADDFDTSSRVLNAQYDSYHHKLPFEHYWAYTSTPGLIGFVLGVFDHFTDFSPGFNLKLFRISVSFINGIFFSLLLLWFYEETGWLAAVLNLALLSFSPWTALLVGNIYWQLWVFYLPLSLFLFWLRQLAEFDISYPERKILWVIFFSIFLKILLTGFEFISAFVLMSTVPFVYYALKEKSEFKVFFYRAVKIGLSIFGATVSGLLVLAMQIAVAEGGGAFQTIFYAFGKRSFGNGKAYIEPYASAIRAPFVDVLIKYIKGPAFTVSLFSGMTVTESPFEQSYLLFILVFFFVSLLVVFLRKAFAREYALLATTWYSLLAPLSWLIIFKAHAYIHVNLDFMIWQMPFMFFGLALVGRVLQRSMTVIKDVFLE